MMLDRSYPGPDTIHRQVLPNGIVVLVYENFAAASVVVEGYLRAGALGGTREQAGLADFAASTLMHGTQHHSFSAIYEALEAVGASLDFSAGRHVTDFSGSALAEDLDLVLDLLADALRNPTFPESEVEQVRGEIMTGLQIRANDTRQMANLRFRELLYAEHPYGISVYGYPDTVATITRDNLIDFHQRRYGPHDMAVVIVGAVKAEDAVRRVEATLGDWHNENYVALPAAPPASRPVITIEDYVTLPNKTQSDIVMGLPGPRRSAEDYLDVSLANTILGVFGMMGRLGSNVREEQGLAYYIYSQLNGGLGPSPWHVATGVAPDRVGQARSSILDEIARMQEELVSGDELADNKTFRTGSLPVSLETNEGLASVIGDMELLELGLDYLQRFPELIGEITPERVRAAAQKYWSTTQLAVVVAGPPPLIAADHEG
jgi:zinc protease